MSVPAPDTNETIGDYGKCYTMLLEMFVEQIARATALQINTLFHWPKKSALVAIGQKIPNGITQAVATNTFSLLMRHSLKQVQTIDQMNTTPRTNPIKPVSSNNWT